MCDYFCTRARYTYNPHEQSAYPVPLLMAKDGIIYPSPFLDSLVKVSREFRLAQTPGYTLSDAHGEVYGADLRVPLEDTYRREADLLRRPHPHWTQMDGKFNAMVLAAWMHDRG